ncbi:4-hydroxyphenylpyruvate dioxygenase [Streptomyces sp. NPDC051162]|uniref:4-hydroxyphenylpyruvate dioxygenase n=1 Tax=Streptomyces sp. NPDC051162 TaxID=3154747 RepID=UPI0034312AC6
MTSSSTPPGFGLSHVEFHVEDLAESAGHLMNRYGFRTAGRAGPAAGMPASGSLALRQSHTTLVLTQALADDHPADAYVRRHGDGVADIALSTPDAAAAFTEAVARGARPLAAPRRHDDGRTTATIAGVADIAHTLVDHDAARPAPLPPDFTAVPRAPRGSGGEGALQTVDHCAICLEAGQLAPTVDFYTRVLGFEVIFTEHIAIGAQAMDSQVVQSPSGTVTLTLIEPDVTAEPGQIDRFLKEHDGPGVQHVAFRSADIVRTVTTLRGHGVDFLPVPRAYYDMLEARLVPARHTTTELRALDILVDEDHDGQLFQLFTRSTHTRRTLFFEVIERVGARTFGDGNIKALYEAVESERATARGHRP